MVFHRWRRPRGRRCCDGFRKALVRDYDGKTAAERVAERRERLINAGVELFGERGYAATSIRSVLQQAGLRDRYFGESFADLDSLLARRLGSIIPARGRAR
jgi:AcrR family transcriptional regulator